MESIMNKEHMDVENAKDIKPVMAQIIGLIHDIVPDLETEITEEICSVKTTCPKNGCLIFITK